MITTLVYGAIALVGLFVFLSVFAPSVFEGLRLRGKKAVKELGKKVNDPIVTADVRIDEAKEKVKDFQKSIRDLRKQVIKEEKKLPGLRAEVGKWESIFIQASKANNTDDAEEASRLLQKADKKLQMTLRNIEDNRTSVETLSEQAAEYLDRVENAEIVKESLEARKIAADLRKEAFSGGKLAADGIGALADLEEAAEDSEAEVLALEEESQEVTGTLVETYSVRSSEHEDRLKRLLEVNSVRIGQ